MRGGRQGRLRPEVASCPRLRVLGDESHEPRPAGAEL